MAKSGYLYRRSSGIYVVRICVPKRLQSVIGRGEIHVSTDVRDSATAKATAFRILLSWQQHVLELDGMDVIKVSEGSPLLAGEGLIQLTDAAQIFELEQKTLLMEVVNSRTSLLCIADGWDGIEVADLHNVDRDPTEGTFDFDSAVSVGHRANITGTLIFYDSVSAAKSFLDLGQYNGEIFYRDAKKLRAVFFFPGQGIHIDNLLLRKIDVERIRLSLSAGITPKMLETAKALKMHVPATPAPSAPATPAPGHKYGLMRVSALLKKFLTEKSSDWKSDHHRLMSGICNTFVELMSDPTLSEIDRPMVMEYRSKLLTLPDDLYQARRRHGSLPLAELIAEVEIAGEPRMRLTSANRYIRRLSEMFNWAVVEELMARNPAEGIGDKGTKAKRAQDGNPPIFRGC